MGFPHTPFLTVAANTHFIGGFIIPPIGGDGNNSDDFPAKKCEIFAKNRLTAWKKSDRIDITCE